MFPSAESVCHHILLPFHMLYFHIILTNKLHPKMLTSIKILLREEVKKIQMIIPKCESLAKKKVPPSN